MQELFFCEQCRREQIDTDFFVDVDEDFFKFKEVSCPKGHKVIVGTSTAKYEYLFSSAANSYRNQNYSECILFLYSGYESYMELFVSSFYLYQLDDMDKMKIMLKNVNRSEVIKGAFYTAYVALFNEVYIDKVHKKFSKIRNKVVHSGYLASSKDCLKMGDAIFEAVITANNKYLSLLDPDNGDFRDLLSFNFDLMVDRLKDFGKSFEDVQSGKVQYYNGNKGSFSAGSMYNEIPKNAFSERLCPKL